MKSPITGKEMKIIYEKRIWNFRGEKYEYIHTSWFCMDSKESFTTDESDTVGFLQVTNQYRTKYGIPFTDEIISIRELYGISATKMSLILGFGTNQWRHYEAGEVPSVSNGRMIRSIMNPKVFLDYIHSSKHLLTQKEYNKLQARTKEIIREKVKEDQKIYVYNHIFSTERGSENGYGQISISRLKNTLLYIIEKCNTVFFTKMNKLLFYIDFIAYRENGMSITGLSYKALNYGPVPERWDRVYSQFDEIVQEPRTIGTREGIVLMASELPDKSIFSIEEIKIIDMVCEYFNKHTSAELSKISHEEEGWKQCYEDNSRIPYNYAFKIKAL